MKYRGHPQSSHISAEHITHDLTNGHGGWIPENEFSLPDFIIIGFFADMNRDVDQNIILHYIALRCCVLLLSGL